LITFHLKQCNCDFHAKGFDECKKLVSQCKSLDQSLQIVYNQHITDSSVDYDGLLGITLNGWKNGSIGYILRYDIINELIEFSKQPQFSVDQILPHSPFEYIEILQKKNKPYRVCILFWFDSVCQIST